MQDILEFLRQEGIERELIDGIRAFRQEAPVTGELKRRIPAPEVYYLGTGIWEKAIAAILCRKNLLLAGPKATGKNILAESLGAAFERPAWNVSFHIGADAAYLVGTDTFDGNQVTFRQGPVTLCAENGGFGILDEINMARNEAMAVLHSALDFRRELDVPGYHLIEMQPQTRYIATMNYGYAGTRELNEALASRFVVLDMPIIAEADLDRLIASLFPNLKAELRSQFTSLFYELDRKARSAEVSEKASDLRGLLDAIDLCHRGLRTGDALAMCISDKTFDPYEKQLIQDVIDERIDPDLSGSDLFA